MIFRFYAKNENNECTVMRTIFVKAKDVDRKWYLIDAEGKVLGRVATKAASILRGKNKPYFAPHQEIGDYVIVVNAEKAYLTGRKSTDKLYYRHSGYPKGLSYESYDKVVNRKPVFPMEHAIRGMLPNGPLGRKLFKNVKVYAGPKHPHSAQKPTPVDIG